MKIQNPHDKFFKESMGNTEVAKDFLANYLPVAVMEVIDLASLQLEKDSFINSSLEENFSDLLFSAEIDGKEGYLYFLFEHKSYIDGGIAFQLLKYMTEIWDLKRNKEHVKELPVVIPLVIYHGRTEWNKSTNLGSMLNGYDQLPIEAQKLVPNFEYLIYDISSYKDEDIKGIAQTRIVLTLLRDIHSGESTKLRQSILRAVYYLEELDNKESGIGYFETIMRYVLSAGRALTKRDITMIVREVENNFPEGSELAMTLADQWREEGIQKGIEKGKQIGKEEALAEVAANQLTERFGKLPLDIKEAIMEADSIALGLLLSNIFRYESVEDVWKYIR